MKGILLLLIISACAQTPVANQLAPGDELRMRSAEVKLPPSFKRAQELLLKMTPGEKDEVIRSYLTLLALGSGHLAPMSGNEFFAGVPRLGIPRIQLAGVEDSLSLTQAGPLRQQGEVLRLGSVNLIRNFEKAQVYGNFAQAEQIEGMLAPKGQVNPPEARAPKVDLQDLDIFLVKSGSEEKGTRHHVCAVRRKGTGEYRCVESQYKDMGNELGLKTTLAEAFDKNRLSSSQKDTIVLRTLASMVELSIIQ